MLIASPYTNAQGAYDPPEQHMRILKESLEIMEKTTNPETFFSRADLAAQKARYCIGEKVPVWRGLTCAQINEVFSDPRKRDHRYRKFIDKLFDEGKEDRLTYQMPEVGYYLLKENQEYFIKRLGGKTYHFCKIRFSENGRLYTYLAKDRSIRKGDVVAVPTKEGEKPQQVVEAFDAPLDELDFPIAKLSRIGDKI